MPTTVHACFISRYLCIFSLFTNVFLFIDLMCVHGYLMKAIDYSYMLALAHGHVLD